MKLLALAAAVLAVATSCAFADDQFCNHDFDAVTRSLESDDHLPVTTVPADKLAHFVADLEASVGHPFGSVTRAFTVPRSNGTAIGLEVGGCLKSRILVLSDGSVRETPGGS